MGLVTTILVSSVKLTVPTVEFELKPKMMSIMLFLTTVLVPCVKRAVLTVESTTILVKVLGEATNAVGGGLLGAETW